MERHHLGTRAPLRMGVAFEDTTFGREREMELEKRNELRTEKLLDSVSLRFSLTTSREAAQPKVGSEQESGISARMALGTGHMPYFSSQHLQLMRTRRHLSKLGGLAHRFTSKWSSQVSPDTEKTSYNSVDPHGTPKTWFTRVLPSFP